MQKGHLCCHSILTMNNIITRRWDIAFVNIAKSDIEILRFNNFLFEHKQISLFINHADGGFLA